MPVKTRACASQYLSPFDSIPSILEGMKTHAFLSTFSFIFLVSCQSLPKKSDTANVPLPTTLEAAVQSTVYRSDENKLRDRYRHPLETLRFFEVQPEMTVIEIWPSSGWYTEILAPYLASQGHYIAATSQSSAPEMTKRGQKMIQWMKDHPEAGRKSTITTFSPPETATLGAPGTADRVLTFRNFHNWAAQKNEELAMKAFFAVLKPGGILGIVDHRGSTKKSQSLQADSGYVREDSVIQLAKKVGFELVGKSEINANPMDKKNYPKGVWTLPPVLAMGEKDRQQYLNIGESDRMTLKFRKP